MSHIQTERNTLIKHFFQTFHHHFSGTGLMLASPMVEPSTPKLTAHQRSFGTHFTQLGKLFVDVGSGSEVDSPNQVIKTIIEKIRTPIALEKRDFSESGRTDCIADSRYIRFICCIRAVFVFHLYHDNISAPSDLQVFQLLAHFMHKHTDTFHIIRIESAQLHTVVLQQPPGKTAHFPFGTHIRTGADDDIHTMLLRQLTKSSNIFITRKIIISGCLFMQVPKDIKTKCIHAQCLTHFNAVLPIFTRNTRIMNLGSLNNKRFAVQQESILSGFKCAGLIAGTSCQQEHRQ